MEHTVQKLVILGSTGSIGRQTLDIVRAFPNDFQIVGLACGDNISQFQKQLLEFKPRLAFANSPGPLTGQAQFSTMEDMASSDDVDLVIIATTGRAGLGPALSALKAGKSIALANKEILVMAGELITELARKADARILPIDSEHNAIWQCLRGEDSTVSRLLLTASGGPFYDIPHEDLINTTAEDALNHPTWKMGKKVTIDSATLLNKGLEAIEAHWLFGIPYPKIEIVIHRQSIVHSMIEFEDGSLKAQMSIPDMHLPIQYALFYPQRLKNAGIARLTFDEMRTFTFEPVNYAQFPCLKLALEAGRKGGTYPAALCGADEIAVELFLKNQISFLDIERVIEKTLSLHQNKARPRLEDIIEADKWARKTAAGAARKEIKCQS
ncbi:MAG: 1-deoxy-D-xylulose-5-phosphate reductoisomerase [Dehalococcoidia bacterium]|nr:1-deoxy-D-xylulose-5-phosphate reductoisomerase [Dehalococcoidia bacterium]MDD5493646.1 1-deoxy-D-xylulose-5-phosphate reductoisomerase [Dehalococcoidia bacterium]